MRFLTRVYLRLHIGQLGFSPTVRNLLWNIVKIRCLITRVARASCVITFHTSLPGEENDRTHPGGFCVQTNPFLNHRRTCSMREKCHAVATTRRCPWRRDRGAGFTVVSTSRPSRVRKCISRSVARPAETEPHKAPASFPKRVPSV